MRLSIRPRNITGAIAWKNKPSAPLSPWGRAAGSEGEAGASRPPLRQTILPIQIFTAAVDRNLSGSVADPRRGLRASWGGEECVHEHGSYRKRTGPHPYSLDDSTRHAGSPANRA